MSYSSTYPGVYARYTCSASFVTRAKAAMVTRLSWLIAWRPAVALALGRLIVRPWPGFRRRA
jgi:hypothetical protein